MDDSSKELKRYIRDLVRDANQFGLVLVVGAGVNGAALHQWDELLGSLLEQTILEESFYNEGFTKDARKVIKKWCQSHFDSCSIASLVKHILGPKRYLLEIQEALYNKAPSVETRLTDYCLKPEDHAENNSCFQLLRATALLCLTRQTKSVATFNFDTLLETSINKCAESVPEQIRKRACTHYGQIVHSEKSDSFSIDFPVYHLHGLLSPPGQIIFNPDESVVFSYDEYFNLTADPFAWENYTPLHLLHNYCTLWIGASLKDWNMLRLLHGSKQRPPTYCLQSLASIRDDFPEHIEHAHDAMSFQKRFFDEMGVHLVNVGEEYADISLFINTLREQLNKK